MKHLIAVRHGETDWNRQNLLQGHADIPLNETGRLQAEQLARKIASHPIDAVITSDLYRAHETAQIIQANRKAVVPIETDHRLREYSFGELEGESVSQLHARSSEHQRLQVESDGEVEERLTALLESLARREETSFLLSTHGMIVLRLYELAGQPLPSIHNCSYHSFVLDIKSLTISAV